MEIIIVGCGLGGLCCVIACRKAGLDVLVVEQAKELTQIGAGIQIPPNGARIMSAYGLTERLVEAGAVELDGYTVHDDITGEVIVARPGKEWARKIFGFPYYAIHRAAYQDVLFKEATRLGARFRFAARVIDVDFADKSSVTLDNGEKLQADVIVGADGINSTLRSLVLGEEKKVSPTGDVAYRAILSRAQLSNNPALAARFQHAGSSLWWGPEQHVMLYPIQNCDVFNLVLLCKDDLPENVRVQSAEFGEMWEIFKDWDPTLRSIISETKNVRKWKLEHMEELSTWTKGSVALLGDACHPTLPYQAQGAAMAVEDGAILGKLLSLCDSSSKCSVRDVLELYEELRKKRTTLNVKGAVQNKELYRLPKAECDERNKMLRELDFWDPEQRCHWLWGDNHYQRDLMAVDTLGNAESEFHARFG